MSRDLNVDQIKKLWTLDLVIQNGSFRKAAIESKVSPSAISQTISSLEASYGRPLLIRDKGKTIPTAEALAILEVVRPAFDAFDRLRELNNAPIPKISWLNFGTYESIAVDLLPGLIETLKNKLPHMRLGVRISRTSQLLTMVRKGELCSALITEVDDLNRFYANEVAQDRLGFYVSRNHPIATKGWNAIHEYGYGTLASSKDGLPRYFTKFLKQFDLPKASIQSDSFETLRASAAAGVIACLLPNRVAKRNHDLIEIAPKTDLKFKGEHKLLVVSQLSCDREETDFIAEESKRFLN